MKKPYPGLREDFNRLWILHNAIQLRYKFLYYTCNFISKNY